MSLEIYQQVKTDSKTQFQGYYEKQDDESQARTNIFLTRYKDGDVL